MSRNRKSHLPWSGVDARAGIHVSLVLWSGADAASEEVGLDGGASSWGSTIHEYSV